MHHGLFVFNDLLLELSEAQLERWLELEERRRQMIADVPEAVSDDATFSYGSCALRYANRTANLALYVAELPSEQYPYTVLGSYIGDTSDPTVVAFFGRWLPEIGDIIDGDSVLYFIVEHSIEGGYIVTAVLPDTRVLREEGAWYGDHPAGVVHDLLHHVLAEKDRVS